MTALALQCGLVNEHIRKQRKKQEGKKIIKTGLGDNRSRIQLQEMFVSS